MKIKVTQEHIIAGEVGSYCECPIALALRDAGFVGVSIGYTVSVAKGHVPMLTTAAMQDFIRAFDQDEGVEPVELEVPWII